MILNRLREAKIKLFATLTVLIIERMLKYNAMKPVMMKFLLFAMSVSLLSNHATAQDDDGIYGDIYESPTVEEVEVDTKSPLDGYTTVDDYYPEDGYSSVSSSDPPYSEQYVDESGNNITNNYYGDYYEGEVDYAYASRIRRFHRYNNSWGYYDPWYTNMYYYNYDPFYWGTSIYAGYWPSYTWGLNGGWGWNSGWYMGFGNNPFGWNHYANSMFGYPAYYGGYGWGGGYWNGYNNGYWNGYYDGLAYGGYYNTYDPYSGIYYGPRGAGETGGTIGSGVRNNSFASVYNDAAKSGKVYHANKDNLLQTADARPVAGNLNSYQVRSGNTKVGSSTVERQAVPQVRNEISKERDRSNQIATSNNSYQRNSAERAVNVPERSVSANADRSRQRIESHSSRTRIQSNTNRPNTYYRGNASSRIDQRQPSRSATDNRGNLYRDLQRTQPSQNGYYRGNSNDSRQQPSRSSGSDYRREDYRRPSNSERNHNYNPPSRNYQPPTRTAPSRSVRPSSAPNHGSSRGSYSPSPSRSSGSGYSPSSGGSRGSSGGPSRGSSGSGSKGGRP